MCLLLLSFNTNHRYPLILAGNRDEFYNRPTQPLHKWKTNPLIAAGRDLRSGGTWLAISEEGRFAAVTNFRNPNRCRKNVRTRGELVTNFLTCSLPAEQSAERIGNNAAHYEGFNLIMGDGERVWYLNETGQPLSEIPPGTHVLSNARLNTPWPKALCSKKQFQSLISAEEIVPEPFFELLLDSKTFPDSELPSTGVSFEMERSLSALFIRMPGYGTRSSALLTLDHEGQFTLIERTYTNGVTESFHQNRIELST